MVHTLLVLGWVFSFFCFIASCYSGVRLYVIGSLSGSMLGFFYHVMNYELHQINERSSYLLFEDGDQYDFIVAPICLDISGGSRLQMVHYLH